MKPFLKIFIAIALAIALALLVMWQHPPELLRVGANYTAKIVCTNAFVAHRDPTEVLNVDVQAPGNPILRLMVVRVDQPAQIVHANILGFIGHGLAVYRQGTGCAAVPDGNVVQARKSSFEPDPIAVAANDNDWPAGARLTLNENVNTVLQNDNLAGPSMRGMAVVSHGKLIAQRYGTGFNETTPLLGWSMTKTVTSALVGMQIQAGKLSLNQDHFWTDAASSAGREKIRLADLLAMASGLKFNESYGDVSDVTRLLFLEPDMANFTKDQPLEHPPGTFWNYSSGTTVLLNRIWMNAAGTNAVTFAHNQLFKPLGMQSALIETDEAGTFVGSSYMYATVADWARFAQFLLQDGVWNGQRLLPEGYVTMMHTVVPASHGKYGQGQVWMDGPGAHNASERALADPAFNLPTDIYWMLGHDGQSIALIPSLELAVIRLGLTPDGLDYQPQALVAEVIKAINASANK